VCIRVPTPSPIQDSERAAVVAAEERARRLESQLQEEKVLSLSAQNVRSPVNSLLGLLSLNLVPLHIPGTVYLL